MVRRGDEAGGHVFDDLSVELTRLEAALDRASAHTVLRRLRPGVPPERSRTLVREATGLELPDQVATFWAWHDGVDEAPGSALGAWTLLGVDGAIDRRSMMFEVNRSVAELYGEAEARRQWSATWLPWAEDFSGRLLLVECEGVAPLTVPAGTVHDHDVEGIPVVNWTAPSIAATVRLWNELLDAGLWRFDPTLGRLTVDFDRLSPEQRRGPY